MTTATDPIAFQRARGTIQYNQIIMMLQYILFMQDLQQTKDMLFTRYSIFNLIIMLTSIA